MPRSVAVVMTRMPARMRSWSAMNSIEQLRMMFAFTSSTASAAARVLTSCARKVTFSASMVSSRPPPVRVSG